MEFFQYQNKINPKKGRLLLSEPYLADPNFERTAILLTEHNDEGSVGFILNKPSESRVSEVMEDLKGLDAQIFIGGPVQQDTLLAASLGVAHIERNGHHYVDGFGVAPDAESAAFANAHPDLYQTSQGRPRLAVQHGQLQLGSLHTPGFASAAFPLWDSLKPIV